MYIILICFLITSFIFLIFGKTFIGVLDKSNAVNYTFFDFFFIGFCVTGTLLNLWSLFFPTNILSLCLLLITSTYLLLKNWSLYKSYFLNLLQQIKKNKLLLGIILVSICIILLYASVTPRNYDSYLYHINAIQWNEMYRAVPGLANFHDRLGFNSSMFTISAAFSFSAIYNQYIFIISSLTFFIFFVWILKNIFFKKGLYGAFLLIYISFFVFQYGSDISSPGTDLVPNLIIAYILFSLVIDGFPIRQKYLVYLVLPLFCITIKLSTFPILMIALVGTYFKYKKIIPSLKTLILFGLLFIIPWMIRNLILSGYVLYPLNTFDFFTFDWKVPIENITETKKWIYSWGRIPFKDCNLVLKMPLNEWFPIWWDALLLKNQIFFILAAISPVFLGIVTYQNRKKKNMINLFLPFILAYSCFLLWFFTAPDIRFLFGPILFLALFPLFLLEKAVNKIKKRLDQILLVFVCYSLFLITNNGIIMFCEDYHSFKYIDRYCYLPKDVSEVKQDRYIEYNNIDLMNDRGEKITLYVPNPDHSQCYDKFPCSWYILPSLQLRGRNLQDGFKL